MHHNVKGSDTSFASERILMLLILFVIYENIVRVAALTCERLSALPCHAMPCHAMPCHAMPCHAMPCHAMPCHAMPCHAMPCHSMPCHAMPSHAMPCQGPGNCRLTRSHTPLILDKLLVNNLIKKHVYLSSDIQPSPLAPQRLLANYVK